MFHPELRTAARLTPRGTVRNSLALHVMRRLTSFRRSNPPWVQIATVDGRVPIRVYNPPACRAPRPALLWMHGGGFVMGDASLDDRSCQRFAQRLNITVASVDYRLAPEYPYPAALDDCDDALRWLTQQPNVDAARIAVGGLSAGGGLAAALAQRLRAQSDRPAVAYQLLAYPMLDDRSADPPHPHAKYFRMWDERCNRFAWRSYVGDADPQTVAPARCSDLAGLPPTWIGVGSLDLMYDESVTYARRLRAAGVPCELNVVDGAFHAFDLIAPKTSVAQSFTEAQLSSLRRALNPC